MDKPYNIDSESNPATPSGASEAHLRAYIHRLTDRRHSENQGFKNLEINTIMILFHKSYEKENVLTLKELILNVFRVLPARS